MLLTARDYEAFVAQEDLDAEFLQKARGSTVACDIETTGLNATVDQIATMQFECDGHVRIVKFSRAHRTAPERIRQLVVDGATRKVFHHAPFDLSFLLGQWGVRARNVACTKVAAKLVLPGLVRSEYSLKPLLRSMLGTEISKDEQQSDWLATKLTAEQVAYATADVIYLRALLDELNRRAVRGGRLSLLEQAFDFLPAAAELRLAGIQDLFGH